MKTIKIPGDIIEAFNALDIIMSESNSQDASWFKNTDEKKCIASVHDNFGRWIRNNWGLWDKESIMHEYLFKMGLWHADDMSSFLLTSYHRYLNNKDLALKEQVESYSNYWP